MILAYRPARASHHHQSIGSHFIMRLRPNVTAEQTLVQLNEALTQLQNARSIPFRTKDGLSGPSHQRLPGYEPAYLSITARGPRCGLILIR